jgi:hypothetical protein
MTLCMSNACLSMAQALLYSQLIKTNNRFLYLPSFLVAECIYCSFMTIQHIDGMIGSKMILLEGMHTIYELALFFTLEESLYDLLNTSLTFSRESLFVCEEEEEEGCPFKALFSYLILYGMY